MPVAKNCYCPWTYLPRTVTVRGCTSRGLLLSADVPTTDITVRGRTCRGLLLSVDILAADYNSHVQKGGIGPSNRPSTCFLQDLL